MKKLYFSLLNFALIGAIGATSAEEISADDTYSIDDVVVTATGTQRRLIDSPAPIAVITAKELSNTNVTTLDEALVKLSPSFAVHTSGMGKTLSFNGLEENYYLFLENGRRLEGDDPFSRIDLSRVKRIEILSGASAALYGTNAVGGVINIITDNPTETIVINSSTRYGSEGRLTESVNVGLNAGKFSSQTSYTYQTADSWQLSPYEEDGDELVASDHVASAGFNKNNVTQEFGFDANDKLKFSVNGGYYNNETDRPQSEDMSYSYNILHENYNYGASASYKISDKSSLIANYYGEKFSSYNRYFKESSSHEIGDTEVNKHVKYQNANLRGIFELAENNTLSAGVEYTIDGLDDDEVDNMKSATTAIYAQDEFTIVKSLTGVVGARLTIHEEFGAHVTPNLSLMYGVGKFNLRATYAAGFRTPTLSELYADEYVSTKYDRVSLSNSDLNPETSNYTSFSAEYNNDWLSLSATGFYNNISNMIEYKAIESEYREESGEMVLYEMQELTNYQSAEIYGVTIAANARLGAGFTIGAGYTALDPQNNDSGKQIDKSVKNVMTANAQWSHSWGGYNLNINIDGRVNGERYYAYDDSYAPTYSLWDLNTRHSFELNKFFLEPGIGIENLFNYVDDRPYCSNYATLSPGRSVYVSLNIRFKH